MKKEDLNNEKQFIEVVETTQPVDGLTVTTYTDNTTKIEVSEDLKKQMIDFMASYNKETFGCGFVEAVAKKINCDFFSKHPITGRATGHAKIGGRYLDKEQLKKLFGYETTKEPKKEGDTKEAADKHKTTRTNHVSRVTKLLRARADFKNRCKEIVLDSIDNCSDLNTFFFECFKAAKKRDESDKKASDWVYQNSTRAKQKAKKVETAQKAIDDIPEDEAFKLLADKLGYSVEELKALKGIKETTK